MPKYYIKKEDFKVVSVAEVMPYIATAYGETKVLIAMAFLTGARLNELLQMIKKNVLIDYERNDLRFLIPTLKRKAIYIREIPFDIENDPFLKDVIIPYIVSLPNEESKLFVNGDRAYQLQLQNLNKKIHGIDTSKYITFHYFRHSAITYISRELRATTWEIQSFTGHKGTSYEDYMIHGATDRFKGKMRR